MSDAQKGKIKSVEHKKKLSIALKGKYKGEKSPSYGKHFYNDGKICIKAKECPLGFVPGKLSRK